jgi:hypothetical protein
VSWAGTDGLTEEERRAQIRCVGVECSGEGVGVDGNVDVGWVGECWCVGLLCMVVCALVQAVLEWFM